MSYCLCAKRDFIELTLWNGQIIRQTVTYTGNQPFLTGLHSY
jgi:hypothetical protein